MIFGLAKLGMISGRKELLSAFISQLAEGGYPVCLMSMRNKGVSGGGDKWMRFIPKCSKLSPGLVLMMKVYLATGEPLCKPKLIRLD